MRKPTKEKRGRLAPLAKEPDWPLLVMPNLLAPSTSGRESENYSAMRTTQTGQVAWRKTRSATLPRKRCLNPV